jgi:hypothetical protein
MHVFGRVPENHAPVIQAKTLSMSPTLSTHMTSLKKGLNQLGNYIFLFVLGFRSI